MDLDANGRTDLFMHNIATGQWFEWLSTGAGAFSVGGNGFWSLGWNLSSTDFNDDGRGDLLLYNATTGVWFQARNLTLGTFWLQQRDLGYRVDHRGGHGRAVTSSSRARPSSASRIRRRRA